MPDELLTVQEVAALLNLNQQTIRNMIDRGDLGAVRVGAWRVRIRQSQLEAFLAAGESGPQFRQSDPWQAVSDSCRQSHGGRAWHDRDGLDRALAGLADVAQEIPAEEDASDMRREHEN